MSGPRLASTRLASISLGAILALAAGCGGAVSDNPKDGAVAETGVAAEGGHDGPVEAALVEAAPIEAAPPTDSGLADGHQDGEASVLGTLAPPTFNPSDGTVFSAAGSVVISPSAGSPSGTIIYYTTDQTVPTHASTQYVGPIQVDQSEPITAIESAPGYADSSPAHASYVVFSCSPLGCSDPVIAPVSSVAYNDFLASVTVGDASATICYRLDGSLPTCSPTGTCGMGSTTYNAASLIPINGSAVAPSDPPTGEVTLTMIACDAQGNVADCGGGPNGLGCEADYVLTVADPSMTAAGATVASGQTVSATWGSAALPSGNAGITPTLQTATQTSTGAVTIQYAVGAPGSLATPSCTSGTTGTNPTRFDSSAGQAATLSSTIEVVAMACKPGYHDSNPTTFTYDLSLGQPTLPPGGPYAYQPKIYVAGAGGPNTLLANDAVNAGSGDVLCYTAGASPTPAATCSAGGGCGTGSTLLGPAAPLAVGNKTSPSTVVSLVACPAPGQPLGSPSPVTQTYTLKYGQLFASSTDPTGGGQGLPGWSFATGGSGLPRTTLSLPSGASTTNGYPVSDTCTAAGTFDAHGHCLWQIGSVEPLPGCVGTEFGCLATSGPLDLVPSYFCMSTQQGSGALACGTTTNACTKGTTMAFGAAPPAATNLVDATNTALGGLYAAGGANPDTLSLLACPDVVTAGVLAVQPSLETDVGP
jgi:Fn3 associated